MWLMLINIQILKFFLCIKHKTIPIQNIGLIFLYVCQVNQCWISKQSFVQYYLRKCYLWLLIFINKIFSFFFSLFLFIFHFLLFKLESEKIPWLKHLCVLFYLCLLIDWLTVLLSIESLSFDWLQLLPIASN